jgi:hypothetical protein
MVSPFGKWRSDTHVDVSRRNCATVWSGVPVGCLSHVNSRVEAGPTMENQACRSRAALRGDNMKSVMFSEIVQVPRRSGRRGPSPLAAYGLTVAIGLPLLVLALRVADPAAPLACIVLPLLAGLALPLCASVPGRLDVSTRFDACHLRMTVEQSLATLGFAVAETDAARLLFIEQGASPWRAASVSVRIHFHTLEVIGPVPTLRRLQALLGGAAGGVAVSELHDHLSERETIAAPLQISDNAGRVAGMAE